MLVHIFRGLMFAISFLTRIPVPCKFGEHENSRTFSWSFFFFPPVGMLMGLIAAIPTAIICALFPYQQAAILFSSAFYVGILEWLSRFLHFDGFCDTCDAFNAPGATPERRLEIMKDPHVGATAVACGAFLIAAKILGMYLILTRTALMTEDLTVFLFIMIMIPALGRLTMLVLSCAGRYPREHGTGSFIVGKVSFFICFCSTILLFLFSVYYLALALRFGTLFSVRDMELSKVIIQNIHTTLASYDTNQIMVIFNNGFYAALTLFIASVFIPAYYWFRESGKMIGGVTGDILGAAGETAELAAIFVFLLIAERF